MPERAALTWRSFAVISLALAFALILNGAVPFIAIPTLGQAVWTTGFSQSFINQSIFSIYATNFGAPTPAAIVFGLSGAYPAGLLIGMGLHPADAYSAMFAGWLCVAFFGAWRLAYSWGSRPVTAAIGALLWLSGPIVLNHSAYSMLALGMALLPFYFYGALRMLEITREGDIAKIARAFLFYMMCCVIAVFMDGYTFVMFAVGSILLWSQQVVADNASRKRLLFIALPAMLFSLGVAYALYIAYVGHTSFSAARIDAFRGWGVDLTFLAIPSSETNWFFDALGWSVLRREEDFFGDTSVWTTTFCLPLALVALVGIWQTRHRKKISAGLLVVALFGFYMALGPSLKINSQKPKALASIQDMSSEYAVMPTGNAWLSENVPGFTSMRASYRWAGLGTFGLWALVMLWASQRQKDRSRGSILVLLALVAMGLPSFKSEWQKKVDMRSMFFAIDSDLLTDLQASLVPKERVAFLPYTNDFLINYLSAKSNVRTYNIGGDKNLEIAQKNWPDGMLRFSQKLVDERMPDDIARLLLDGEADVVVLPYFDALWAAHYFPCKEEALELSSTQNTTVIEEIPAFDCPAKIKQSLSRVRDVLRQMPRFDFREHDLFATIRVAPYISLKHAKEAFLARYFSAIQYPINTSQKDPTSQRILQRGWHTLETDHVWSDSAAVLELPLTPACKHGDCAVVLKFWIFGANEENPAAVRFSVVDGTSDQSISSIAIDGSEQTVLIPVNGDASIQNILIEISNAQSPADVSESTDTRTLGIALRSIDMVERSQN